MAYDINALIREYSNEYVKVTPNRIRPKDLVPLLVHLDRFTKKLEREDLSRRELGGEFVAECDKPCMDLRRWRVRLNYYIRVVDAQKDMNDRWATLHRVANPLFFGWYGDPHGSANEDYVDMDGFWPGYNFSFQRTADLATPYRIANGLEILDGFEAANRKALFVDLAEGAKRMGRKAADIAKVSLGALSVVAVVGVLGWTTFQVATFQGAKQ